MRPCRGYFSGHRTRAPESSVLQAVLQLTYQIISSRTHLHSLSPVKWESSEICRWKGWCKNLEFFSPVLSINNKNNNVTSFTGGNLCLPILSQSRALEKKKNCLGADIFYGTWSGHREEVILSSQHGKISFWVMSPKKIKNAWNKVEMELPIVNSALSTCQKHQKISTHREWMSFWKSARLSQWGNSRRHAFCFSDQTLPLKV